MQKTKDSLLLSIAFKMPLVLWCAPWHWPATLDTCPIVWPVMHTTSLFFQSSSCGNVYIFRYYYCVHFSIHETINNNIAIRRWPPNGFRQSVRAKINIIYYLCVFECALWRSTMADRRDFSISIKWDLLGKSRLLKCCWCAQECALTAHHKSECALVGRTALHKIGIIWRKKQIEPRRVLIYEFLQNNIIVCQFATEISLLSTQRKNHTRGALAAHHWNTILHYYCWSLPTFAPHCRAHIDCNL